MNVGTLRGLHGLHGLLGVLLATLLLCGACTGTLRTAEGVVLDVQGTSLTKIDSFTLRTADGQLLTFTANEVTFDQQSFPPQHLREHQALAQPVRVTYRVEDSRNVAIKLQDAPQR